MRSRPPHSIPGRRRLREARVIALERCCQQQLMVEATGHKPVMVPPDKSRFSRDNVGSDYIGWLHFQTIWDQLVRTQPDMFD